MRNIEKELEDPAKASRNKSISDIELNALISNASW